MQQNKKFEYTYAAPTESERRETEEIRKQYQPLSSEDDRLTRLKKLDGKVKRPPEIWSICLGTIGLLIFGGGMAIVLETSHIVLGSFVAVLGLFPIAAAYPVYKYVLKKGKEKYGEEIVKLASEILNDHKE